MIHRNAFTAKVREIAPVKPCAGCGHSHNWHENSDRTLECSFSGCDCIHFFATGDHARNWYEMGQLKFPNQSPQFYRMFAAYWDLKAEVESLQRELKIPYEFPYKSITHLW